MITPYEQLANVTQSVNTQHPRAARSGWEESVAGGMPSLLLGFSFLAVHRRLLSRRCYLALEGAPCSMDKGGVQYVEYQHACIGHPPHPGHVEVGNVPGQRHACHATQCRQRDE